MFSDHSWLVILTRVKVPRFLDSALTWECCLLCVHTRALLTVAAGYGSCPGSTLEPLESGHPFSLFFFLCKLFIYLFGCTRSWSQQVGTLIFTVACQIFSCGMQDLVPRPGINPWTPCLRDIVLAPGPPAKSQSCDFSTLAVV